MDSAIEIFAFLVGVSAGLFLLIALVVLLPGRSRAKRRVPRGPVWFGGPHGSDHGHGESTTLALTGRPAHWIAHPDVDWPRLAETSEPGARLGGASAGW